MTHQEETNAWHSVLEHSVLQLLAEESGSADRFLNVLRLLFNEAMRIERSAALGAAPYQRTPERQRYANGFKPKTLNTRLGALNVQVPQVRGGAPSGSGRVLSFGP